MHKLVRCAILMTSSPADGRFAPFGRCGCPGCVGRDLEGVLRLWEDDRATMARLALAQVAMAQAQWSDMNVRFGCSSDGEGSADALEWR